MLKYLKGTVGHGIVCGRVNRSSDQLLGYIDLDFVGDLDKRRSITEYVYTLVVEQLVGGLSTVSSCFINY